MSAPQVKEQRRALLAGILAGSLALAGCSYTSETGETDSGTVPGPRGPVSLDKNDYPVFPDRDAGADPSVPAELGGRGFSGEGWETNTDFDFIGDPRAIKGGLFRDALTDFPGTMRMVGPETTSWNSELRGVVHERLLEVHPTTLEYIPSLATHWQISEDKRTFRYRIDPNARWSDGRPVSAEDVVASWSLMMDPGLQDPMQRLIWDKFEKPEAESQYIVRVTSKRRTWKNFLTFSASLPIFPAHVLKTVDGATYLKEYNFKTMPGSGPYELREEDVVKGKSITWRRRPDYWAQSYRRNVGLHNFDEIRYVVVRDRNLSFEMFKRGDLDTYYVNRAQMWKEELEFDKIQRGLIQKRKIFNQAPQGIQGFAFNMRRPPLDDVRVRKALNLLFNRKQMIEKLFYNEYVPQNSHWAGSVYENPDNPKNLYNPEEALRLLAEAGWKERDSRGRLVKNGEPLTLELLYPDQGSETYMTVFQEDLRNVGIGLNLRLVNYATMIKLLDERKFDMLMIGWTSSIFPDPETEYRSTLADQESSNNITGLKNRRVDEILDAYEEMFDLDQRIQAIKEIDNILANQYLYILQWYGPFTRVLFWNRFGHPPGYVTRTGDQRDLLFLWWIDPEKSQRLKEAQADSSIQLEVGPSEDRYWLEYSGDVYAETSKIQ